MPNDYTSAGEWRSVRRDGTLVTLPNGNKAYLRRTLNFQELLDSGFVPNPLLDVIKDAVARQDFGALDDAVNEDPIKQAQMLDLLASQMPSIFVAPKVEAPPTELSLIESQQWNPEDPDTISLFDLTVDDMNFAFSFAQGGPATVAQFQVEVETLAALQDGEAVGDTPSETSSD